MRLINNLTSLLSLNINNITTTTHLPSHPSLHNTPPARIPLNETVRTQAEKVLSDLRAVTFREVQITSSQGPTTNPENLPNVRLYFSDRRAGTLSLTMTPKWGEWNGLVYNGAPFPAGYNSLPARIPMDILLADQLIKRAGFRGGYRAVYVLWPSGLRMGGEDQPYYCFAMEGEEEGLMPEFVYVGVNGRRVMTALPRREGGESWDGG